jgi:hypothetical protein
VSSPELAASFLEILLPGTLVFVLAGVCLGLGLARRGRRSCGGCGEACASPGEGGSDAQGREEP